MTKSVLEAKVRNYATARQLDVDFSQPLDFGQDGCVWKTLNDTAVKATERQSNYIVERDCYRRLDKLTFR